MDLQKKLAYLSPNRQQQKPKQTAPEKISSGVKALARLLNAEIINPAAPYLRIVNTHRPAKNLLTSSPFSLSRLSKNALTKAIDPENCLFFDLETTGLAGGTGTFAFLLGFGYFEGQRLTVEQYFLPDFGREYDLFQKLQTLFLRFSILVSYNGKSFDYPLLRNRFTLNRLKNEWRHWQHLDLLHIARRLWRDSFSSCNLATIEEAVLNRKREGDIPGAFIPQAYFNFINSGLIHQIKRIIEHNFQDIVSLADLLLKMAQIEREPQVLEEETALIRLAALAYELDDYPYFSAILNLFAARQNTLPAELMFRRSLFNKQRKNWPQALTDWQKLLAKPSYVFFALEELAKYYEHTAKDLPQALHYTQKALNDLEALRQIYPYRINEKIINEFRKRRQRLKDKMKQGFTGV